MAATNGSTPGRIRPVGEDEADTVLAIVNAAAMAYRGHIPADCWHEPYMGAGQLRAELDAGLRFAGFEAGGSLVGVMGVQRARAARLIRHAYVLPAWQGRGLGALLLDHCCSDGAGQWLVGTWRAATWATRFYERQGFRFIADELVPDLLRTFWTIPDRQSHVSTVLARPALDADGVDALIAAEAQARR